MSRRPLDPTAGEDDRRAGRMAPGGGLRSEAPIKRLWPMVGGMGVPPLPPVEIPAPVGYTRNSWSLDDASTGHDNTTQGYFANAYPSGPDAAGNHTTGALCQLPPLAPGSTYSVQSKVAYSPASGTYRDGGSIGPSGGGEWLPDETGMVGVDFWMTRPVLNLSDTFDSQPTRVFSLMDVGFVSSTYRTRCEARIGFSSTTMAIVHQWRILQSGSQTTGAPIYTLYNAPSNLPADVCHVRWEITPSTGGTTFATLNADGSSRIFINGAPFGTPLTGAKIYWPKSSWLVALAGAGTTNVNFDELKLIGYTKITGSDANPLP